MESANRNLKATSTRDSEVKKCYDYEGGSDDNVGID